MLSHLLALSVSLERFTIRSDSKRDTTLSCVRILLLLHPDFPLIITFSGFIFAGALFGFILARLQYLSIDGKFREGSSPGEWYWLRSGHMRVGITLHLGTIIPAGFLLVFQVRHCSLRASLFGYA